MHWRRALPILGLLAACAVAALGADGRGRAQELVVGQEASTLAIIPASAAEAAGAISVGIARTGSTQETVTFRADVFAGTAEVEVDFKGMSAPFTIVSGSGGVGFNIVVLDDTLDEDDETVQVRIYDVVGAAPAELFGTFTIEDDDASPTISIGPGTTVAEDAGTVHLPLTLSEPSGRAVSVMASTVAGSARPGSDFTALAGSPVQLAAGQTSTTVPVVIVDDAVAEPTEQLTVQLSSPTNATLGTGSAALTITDSDPPTPPRTTTTRPTITIPTVPRSVPTTAPPASTTPPRVAEPQQAQEATDGGPAVARRRPAGDEQAAPALPPSSPPPAGPGPEAAGTPPGAPPGDVDQPEAAGPDAPASDDGGRGGRSRTEVAPSELVSSVARPQDIDLTARSLATSMVAAGGLLGLIAYSSELFDSTFEANERRIRRALRWLPGRGEAPRNRTLGIVACVLAGGAIFTALSDDLGLDVTTAMLFVGMTIAVAATSFWLVLADVAFVRRRFGASGIMQAVPTGLMIGAAGVLLSKLIGFHPGYAYGVVAGWAYSARMTDRDEGHLAALTTVNLLGVALLAWLARAPLASAASGDDPAALAVAADAALTGIFLLCLDSGIVGLIPIRFLRGRAIWRWSTVLWTVLAFVAITIFVLLVLQPSGSRVLGGAGVGRHVLVLCVGFAGASGAFWAWFRFRPDPYPEQDDPELVAWVPPDLPT